MYPFIHSFIHSFTQVCIPFVLYLVLIHFNFIKPLLLGISWARTYRKCTRRGSIKGNRGDQEQVPLPSGIIRSSSVRAAC